MTSRNTLEVMARLGHGARGIVYCLIGGLALLAAFGSGGQTGGSRSALSTLLGQPFGRVLLIAIALGFVCFAVWRFLEAAADADHRGNGWKGLAIRGARLGGGAIASGLAVSALSLAFGWGGGGSDDRAARDWTAWLMSQPFGPWLVGAVGVGVIGGGIGFMIKGLRGHVTERLACSPDVARWAVPLGRLGFCARGIVFLIIGGFLILAALHSRAAEAKGLGGALEALQGQPFGWIPLGLTAAGLFAFGIFGFVEALYRRIDTPDLDDAKDAVVHGVRNIAS